jgi:hypothetical protein
MRWQRIGESSGNEAKAGALNDRAPGQQLIEMFHGSLRSGPDFCGFLRGAATRDGVRLEYPERRQV